MKLSDQLEIDSQNFVKEMYQTPIFRNHIWYPSIFINKSYLPFRPMLAMENSLVVLFHEITVAKEKSILFFF